MLIVIAACEIGFWVVIALGLLTRYLLRRPRAGLVLLAMAPVVDVVLLVATAVHLRSGAVAGWTHGVAALYIGFSVAYGHRMIHWADVRFAHRFAGGPAPVRPAGAAYTRACWGDVGRTGLAVGIAAAIITALTWWVGDTNRTEALDELYPTLGIILALETLWAISYTVWPRRGAHTGVTTTG